MRPDAVIKKLRRDLRPDEFHGESSTLTEPCPKAARRLAVQAALAKFATDHSGATRATRRQVP
jgi:hypothetical protein